MPSWFSVVMTLAKSATEAIPMKISAGPPMPNVVWGAIRSPYLILCGGILIFWAICHRFFMVITNSDDCAA